MIFTFLFFIAALALAFARPRFLLYPSIIVNERQHKRAQARLVTLRNHFGIIVGARREFEKLSRAVKDYERQPRY